MGDSTLPEESWDHKNEDVVNHTNLKDDDHKKNIDNHSDDQKNNADAIRFKEQQDLLKKFQLLPFDKPLCDNYVDPSQSHKYQFWDTQPVPKFVKASQQHFIAEAVLENKAIEPPLKISDVRQEPFSLPEPFCWSDLEIDNETELMELYTFLAENYVEDEDNWFRFDYSPQFLLWALKAPGWMKKWHCGVRVKTSRKLIAFISAVPSVIRVYDEVIKMVEINFLCVHKKLRSKRVAPVLIREITRRVNCEGIFQAAFTAGVILPKPISTCRYWHRSLNPKKLIEVKFSRLPRKMTMQRTLKLFKLPEQPLTSNLSPLMEHHIDDAHRLLKNYLKKFYLAPKFSREDFRHFFLPREDVIYSYVVVNKENRVTDLISFYSLPSSVLHHARYKSVRAAYSFYNVATSVPLKQLINDALILARNSGYDVFNALDLMDNKKILEALKFGTGDGNLQYYLYNWKCPVMKPEKVGLVLQ